ncbi:MAG TPA: hypothetical protein VHI13_14440 [Candidatus Kapabacteria bacterium]|nr:hypothetical protein [Candidatus Kapabacteria bacterium]
MPTMRIVQLMIVAALILPCFNNLLRAQPVVSIVGKETLDLGAVPFGVQERDVAITNTGNSTLIIVSIDSGAAAAHIDRREIAPGDTAMLHVSLDVEPRRLWAVVAVETNDPKRRFVNIRLTARIFAPVSVEELGSDGFDRVGQVSRRTVRLANETKEPLTLVPEPDSTYCSNGSVAVDMRSPTMIYPKEGTLVTLEYVPGHVGPGHCIVWFTVREFATSPVRIFIAYRATGWPNAR